MVGKILGHYEILEPLGAGGMGELYRARDTKLDRDVAIKVLPEDFAADAERLARFTREAKLLATLNHPNIAGVYGLEDEGETRFIAMELVEGETLAVRLARDGRAEVSDAIAIARQIAEALEAAHRSGIIHRDLKPANAIVSSDGRAKVLDFGLAKAQTAAPPTAPHTGATQSPTATAHTGVGVIMGTAPYMSPEQARGKPVDKRTDIWSFGCVLYELLTGRSPFARETAPDTLAAIMKEEPDWTALPGDTPAGIRRLLSRCLRKDPGNRLHDVADARIELDDAMATSIETSAAVGGAAADRELRRPEAGGPEGQAAWNRPVPVWLAAGLMILAVVAGYTGGWMRTAALRPPVTADLIVPETIPAGLATVFGTSPFAISPDGRFLARVEALGGISDTQIALRELGDELVASKVEGTEGAKNVVFAPEGDWLAFIAGFELKKVRVSGGSPETLAPDVLGDSLSWGPDDTLLFDNSLKPGETGLWQVRADGEDLELRVDLSGRDQELAYKWPDLLPDGQNVLIAVQRRSASPAVPARSAVALLSLATGESVTLIEDATRPRYAPTGHLIFARGADLWAVPFDPERGEVQGREVRVVEDVMTNERGNADYDFSDGGLLAYVRSSPSGVSEIVQVDLEGNPTPLPLGPGQWLYPKVSPDGAKLAATLLRDSSRADIFVYDFATGRSLPLTFDGRNYLPVWGPRGESVALTRLDSDGAPRLMRLAIDGGPSEPIDPPTYGWANDWLSNGQLVFHAEVRQDPTTRRNIGVSAIGSEGATRWLLNSVADEVAGQVSPDGTRMAYVSDADDGRRDVYWERFPEGGGRIRVSTNGGTEPRWSRSGEQLFYREGRRMMVVDVPSDSDSSPSGPRLLFEGDYSLDIVGSGLPNYDVAGDGQTFVMVAPAEDQVPVSLVYRINWFAELRRLVPTER